MRLISTKKSVLSAVEIRFKRLFYTNSTNTKASTIPSKGVALHERTWKFVWKIDN